MIPWISIRKQHRLNTYSSIGMKHSFFYRLNSSDERETIPTIHIHSSLNNTIISCADHRGNVQCWSSAGTCGFKGSRRSTTYAAQAAAEDLAKKSQMLGFSKAHVVVKGIGNGKKASVRGLESGGLSILSIQDKTAVPFNGCRPPRKRRV